MRDIHQPAFDAPATDWQVYGDALQEAGDPRGELIALGIAGNTAARDAHVKANWPKLVGDVPPDGVELDWHYGIVRAATVKVTADSPDVTSALLASPAGKDLRAITLRGYGTVDLAKPMDVLARRAPATCTSFAFIDHRATEARMLVSRDFDPPDNLVRLGALEPFFARAEAIAIEVADLTQVKYGEIDAPNLRELSLRGLRLTDGNNDDDIASTLGGATWPKLESFELRCVETWLSNVVEEVDPYAPVYDDQQDESDEGENDGTNWGAFVQVLSPLAKCPLRRLALTSFDSVSSMLDAIALAGLAPTLRELDLSDSSIGDTHVAWLLEHRALFAKLETLRLERTPLTKLDALKALGPRVLHSAGGGATYRYCVGQE